MGTPQPERDDGFVIEGSLWNGEGKVAPIPGYGRDRVPRDGRMRGRMETTDFRSLSEAENARG